MGKKPQGWSRTPQGRIGLKPLKPEGFSENLVPKGWGHFDPPANYKTEDPKTMKLCTSIVIYLLNSTIKFSRFSLFLYL